MFEEVLDAHTRKNFQCVVARWIDVLSESDQKMVNDALEKHGFYVTFKACRNYGYQGSESAFYRHAKGQCPCSNTR